MSYTIAEREKEEQRIREEALSKISVDYGRLKRLWESEDFQWWLNEHVLPMEKTEREKALNCLLPKDVIYIHCCRHDAIREITRSVPDLLEAKLKQLQK